MQVTTFVPCTLPTSPAIVPRMTHPLSPTSISRSSSSSSNSSASQIVATPSSFKRERLLPAVPISIDATLSSPYAFHRVDSAIDFHAVAQDIVGSLAAPLASPIAPYQQRPFKVRETFTPPRSSSPHRSRPNISVTTDTPPRPRRRRISTTEVEPVATPELLVPRLPYNRAASPASINTTSSSITETPTPKARTIPDRPAPAPPVEHRLNELFVPDRSTSIIKPGELYSVPLTANKKRDSTQRRLSALRGLVANLDFDQHWSVSEQADQEDSTGSDAEGIFWACGEPIKSTSSKTAITEVEVSSTPMLEIPIRRRRLTDATPPHVGHNGQLPTPPLAEVTPPTRTITRRLPNSTPPRRPRLFRSSSDLLSKRPIRPVQLLVNAARCLA